MRGDVRMVRMKVESRENCIVVAMFDDGRAWYDTASR